MVARLGNPDVGSKQAALPQPGWSTLILVVHRQGDHKGRPYQALVVYPNIGLASRATTRVAPTATSSATLIYVQDGGPHIAFSTLNGITTVGTDTVWAVGYREDDTGNRRPLIVKATCTNGGDACSWSEVSSPVVNGAWLNSISKPDSSQHMWAVGSRYDPITKRYVALVEWWNGSYWKIQDVSISGQCPSLDCNPGGKTNELHSVWYSSEGDVWAAGEYRSDSASTSGNLMLHWSDTVWSRANVPNPGLRESNRLLEVGTVPGQPGVAVGVWAVGSYVPYQGAPSQTLVEHLPPATYNTLGTPSPSAVSYSTSYYETSIDGETHYEQGCSAAQNRESGVIMLNYGLPVHWQGNNWTCCWSPGDHYGTILPGTYDLVEVENGGDFNILIAVEMFASGYHDCLDPEQDPLHITLVPSINNDNQDSGAALTTAHADAWEQMVESLLGFVEANDLSSEIDVAAGMSIHPSWSTYSAATTWLNRYSDYAITPLYNFGSTDGYPIPPAGTPTPVVSTPWSASAWTTQQLYNVSSVIGGATLFPQIYHPTWARSWYALKRWSIDSGVEPLEFVGAMSECAASPCANQQQQGEYFTAEQGWQVLWQEVNADPDEAMHQELEQSSDVACSNGVESEGCEP